ncbi:MAG: site-specific integrase [Cyclobacteriaceae bacterium]|nr:site-specific integrase [Cyclobacteriaceae bacterium]
MKLRVGMTRNMSRLYGLNFSFTESEFEKLQKNQLKEPYKDTWNKIAALVKKADTVIDGLMPYFSFETFREQFLDTPTRSFVVAVDKTSLVSIGQSVADKYKKQNRLSMAVKMKDSVRSIIKFVNEKNPDQKRIKRAENGTIENIPMRVITPSFCRAYEEYMYEKSKTGTRNGAGINMRHIRILFNQAIAQRLIPREWYPFKRESGEVSAFEDPYVIPNEQKVKVYLNEQETIKLADITHFETERQQRAQVAYFISFYCNGSNAADFLRFKFRDIIGDFIIFYREKIKNASKGNRKPIKVYLSQELKDLIAQYGNPPAPDNYIFPWYKPGMTEEEMFVVRNRFNQEASKSIKVLLKKNGIDKRVSIGKARHALANILKRNKVDREFAKDIFGHTSIVTADNYYGQFDDDIHASIMANIVSVKKIKSRVAQET